MTDTTEPAPSARVSVTKPVRTSASADDSTKVKPPKTIELATIAIGVTIVGLAGRALGLLGSTPTLQNYLIDANAKAKKPVENYAATKLSGDLHSLRSGALIQSAVVAVALVLLVFALRRTRSAGGSRWALLIIIVLTSLPFYVIPVPKWPVIPQVSSVVAGVAAIAALVLVFLPPSAAYFRQCRDILTPPELRGQPRPGLAGLFGPRRTGAARGGAARGGFGAARAAATRPANSASPARPTRSSQAPAKNSKARAKVRSEAEARGAELARSRAKASKSRRFDS